MKTFAICIMIVYFILCGLLMFIDDQYYYDFFKSYIMPGFLGMCWYGWYSAEKELEEIKKEKSLK